MNKGFGNTKVEAINSTQKAPERHLEQIIVEWVIQNALELANQRSNTKTLWMGECELAWVSEMSRSLKIA